jgi:hypothetical protein
VDGVSWICSCLCAKALFSFLCLACLLLVCKYKDWDESRNLCQRSCAIRYKESKICMNRMPSLISSVRDPCRQFQRSTSSASSTRSQHFFFFPTQQLFRPSHGPGSQRESLFRHSLTDRKSMTLCTYVAFSRPKGE